MKWNDPPTVMINNAMDAALENLSSEVSDDPSFSEVTGLPREMLLKHAIQAVAVYAANNKEADRDTATALVHVYCLGFVVGMRYGEQREKGTP
jgi:hypothetical protein